MSQTEKCLFMMSCALVVIAAGAPAEANEAQSFLTFQSLTSYGKASRQVFIHTGGRITIDAAWSQAAAEMTVTLSRPNGSVASQISGTGGSLTLTYGVSQQEVDVSRAANYVRWNVEVARGSTAGPPATGKLSIRYPWEPITIVQNRHFKLGPLANVPVNKYTYSETFAVLGPGTIRVTASWTPSSMVSASLVQNTVGAAVQKSSVGPFQVAHRVGEQSLNVPAWNCTFQNLSQKTVAGTVRISFVPDR
jgi:hypothetical protein